MIVSFIDEINDLSLSCDWVYVIVFGVYKY